jgi:hypothetical protein
MIILYILLNKMSKILRLLFHYQFPSKLLQTLIAIISAHFSKLSIASKNQNHFSSKSKNT